MASQETWAENVPISSDPEKETKLPEIDTHRIAKHLRLREERVKHYRMLPLAVIFYLLSFATLFAKIQVEPSFEVQSALSGKWGEDKPDIITTLTPRTFPNVGSVPDLWEYLEQRLVPEVFDQKDTSGNALDSVHDMRVLTYNKMLGGLLFETSYAYADECENSEFSDFFGYCYPTTWDAGDDAEYWNATQVWLEDELATAEAVARVQQLKAARWVSEATKWFQVSLVVYNGEYDMYARMVQRFDFKRGGRVLLKQQTASISARPYDKWFALPLDLAFVAALLAIMVEQAVATTRALRRKALVAHLLNFWTLVDVAVVGVGWTLVGQWSVIYDSISEIDASNFEDVTWEEYLGTIGDLGSTMGVLLAFRVAGMIFMLLAAVRILKYFTFQPRLAILTKTLKAASGELGHFAILFFLIFVSYVLGGHFLFGASVQGFSTIAHSVATCFRFLSIGDVSYDDMRAVSGTGAFVYFWSFFLMNAALLLNVLLAIVMDAYASVNADTPADAETIGDELEAMAAQVFERYRSSKVCPQALKGVAPLVPTAALHYILEAGDRRVSAQELAGHLSVSVPEAEGILARVRQRYQKQFGIDEDKDGVPDELEKRLDRLEAMIQALSERSAAGGT